MNYGTTKTEKGIKGTKLIKIGKLFVKTKTHKSQDDDGYINLLETTLLTMVETARNLHDHQHKNKRQSCEKES
jgi:hypothetical protein